MTSIGEGFTSFAGLRPDARPSCAVMDTCDFVQLVGYAETLNMDEDSRVNARAGPTSSESLEVSGACTDCTTYGDNMWEAF